MGACAAGLFGLPQLQCQLNGSWNTTAVVNPCSCTSQASSEPSTCSSDTMCPFESHSGLLPRPDQRRQRQLAEHPEQLDRHLRVGCLQAWLLWQPPAPVPAEWLAGHLACMPAYASFPAALPAIRWPVQSLPLSAGRVGCLTFAEITCAASNHSQANFATTVGGTANVVGTCAAGYSGTATASCSLAGQWSFSGSCTRTTKLGEARPGCDRAC